MEYSKLVAVTGLPGLFELINSKSDGAIVKSLDDNTTRFVSSRIHNLTQLESIEIYTIRENVNLVDVFNAMDSAGGNLPEEKDAAATKKYFEKVYPDMDFDRVYASDMKKMVKWFSILKKNDIEIKLTEMEEELVAEEVPEEKPVKEEKKEPKEKAPAKKTATKKAEPEEEKPAKKTAAKKAATKKK